MQSLSLRGIFLACSLARSLSVFLFFRRLSFSFLYSTDEQRLGRAEQTWRLWKHAFTERASVLYEVDPLFVAHMQATDFVIVKHCFAHKIIKRIRVSSWLSVSPMQPH